LRLTDCGALNSFHAFLNRSSDGDEIWYRDRLYLGKEDKIHFVSKKVNKKYNPGMFSNRDF